MFQEINSPDRAEPKWYGARIMAGSAAGLLVSFGLCGVGSKLHLGNGIGVLNTVGIVLFGVSLLGIVVGVIVLVVEAIVAGVRR